jgi:hypothetical protein
MRGAGFETDTLRTLNVFGDESEYFNLKLLSGSSYPLGLRGRNIFYSGRRVDERRGDAWKSFYLTDPMGVEGRLEVRESDTIPGTIELVLRNEGKTPWHATGETAVRLQFEAITSDGRREGDFIELPLESDVPPHGERVISLPIGRTHGSAVVLLRIEAIVGGFGRLENLGVKPVECVVSAGAYGYLSSLVQ